MELQAEAIIIYLGLNCKKMTISFEMFFPTVTETHLNTLNCSLVVSIEDTHLLTVVAVPDVNPAVTRPLMTN